MPQFGKTPPNVGGRSDILAEYRLAFHQNEYNPHRISYIEGPRGWGKTVLLNEIQREAQEARWIVFSDDATPGLTDRLQLSILRHISQKLKENNTNYKKIIPDELTLKLPGILSAKWSESTGSTKENQHNSTRSLLELVIKSVQPTGGVLITVDELHRLQGVEFTQLGNDLQYLIRKNLDRHLAFVGAGLPGLRDRGGVIFRGPTFLHRAKTVELTQLSREESTKVLIDGFANSGLECDEKTAESAQHICYGVPYLLQLIGYSVTEVCYSLGHDKVSYGALDKAIDNSTSDIVDQLYALAIRDLSGDDLNLVMAVASDHDVSKRSVLIERLGWDEATYVKHRSRLIRRGLLIAAEQGYLTFPFPPLRAWIRSEYEVEAAAAAVLSKRQQNVSEHQLKLAAHRLVSGLPVPPPVRCKHIGVRSGIQCRRSEGHSPPHRYT